MLYETMCQSVKRSNLEEKKLYGKYGKTIWEKQFYPFKKLIDPQFYFVIVISIYIKKAEPINYIYYLPIFFSSGFM
jgi:hypothetical protein